MHLPPGSKVRAAIFTQPSVLGRTRKGAAGVAMKIGHLGSPLWKGVKSFNRVSIGHDYLLQGKHSCGWAMFSPDFPLSSFFLALSPYLLSHSSLPLLSRQKDELLITNTLVRSDALVAFRCIRCMHLSTWGLVLLFSC